MKEKDFYKEVMRRGFEPDFNKLSGKIQSEVGQPEEAARVKPRSLWAVAAAAVIGIGLAGVIALKASNLRAHTEPLTSVKAELAADSSQESASVTNESEPGTSNTDDRLYLYYNGKKVFFEYETDNIFDEDGNYKGTILYREEIIDDIEDSFYDSVRFLGLTTEPSEENGETHKRLETNAVPAGTPVFRERNRNSYYFWLQKSSATVDIICLGDNSLDPVSNGIGQVVWLDDINKNVQLVGAKVLEAKNEYGEYVLGLDRSTFEDPSEDRVRGNLWSLTFEPLPEDEHQIPDSKYVISNADEIKAGMYVWLEVRNPNDFDKDHPFYQGYVFRFDNTKDDVSE